MSTLPNTESDTSAAEASQVDVRQLVDFRDSDLVIGLVGMVGTEWDLITTVLKDRLRSAGYNPIDVRVSTDVITKISPVDTAGVDEATRITLFMDAGDKVRKDAIDDGVLADGIASIIATKRESSGQAVRNAFIVNSLKHPQEVMRLRRIYAGGFYLLGVQPDDGIRNEYLKRKGVADDQIAPLVARDGDKRLTYGQQVNDTFHLADFFVRMDGNQQTLNGSLKRICDILFGYPYSTPTFDEFAMFLAFAASLRSADLSRQVGAVVARDDGILATGANDCPRYGGGLYWPQWSEKEHNYVDELRGRDYRRAGDSNRLQQDTMIGEIVRRAEEKGLDGNKLKEILQESAIRDITEYGRVVHAEMEALLSCARNGISTVGASLFSTTFPCHNCAKHIIAAGIERVVFIEPYDKSKAASFHDDSINVGPKPDVDIHSPEQKHVRFEPFVGVGPRRFFDLFSMRLGAGGDVKRKASDGGVLSWQLSKDSTLRVQMRPGSFRELETEAKKRFDDKALVQPRKNPSDST